MKDFLLTSFLSWVAIKARDKYRIVTCALKHPEEVGALANRQLAYFLIVRLCDPAKVFVDDVEIYTINDAKAGIFKDIAYDDYPHTGKNSMGGKLGWVKN